MATENNEFLPDGTTPNPDYVATGTNSDKKIIDVNDPDVARLISEQVDTKLADIKEKLNKSYTERDEANRKATEAETALKAANIKRLEDEGKHKEALELKLADADAKITSLTKHNTELTRDNSVRNELSGLDFRSTTAYDMAFKTLTQELVMDDKGQWTHRSGVSIREFVSDYAKGEEQQFLFKPKANSGNGTSKPADTNIDTSKGKSLFAMSQADVIKMYEKGDSRR